MSATKGVLEAVALLKNVRAVTQPFPLECINTLTRTYTILPPPWIAIPGHTGEQRSAYLIAWKAALEQSERESGDAITSAYSTVFPQPRSWGNATRSALSMKAQGDLPINTVESSASHAVGLWSANGKPSFGVAELVRATGTQSEPFQYLFFWGHTDRKKKPKGKAGKRERPGPGNAKRADDDDDGISSSGSVEGHSLSKACLSQWWPCRFVEEGVEYTTAEQYMMAWKARVFDDQEICDRIQAASDPFTIKKLGREVKGFNPDKWDQVKYSIVAQGNFLKFSQDKALRAFLMGTGESVLVEASPYDNVWGIGVSESNAAAKKVCLTDPSTWHGKNLLGFALMDARREIGRVYDNVSRVSSGGSDGAER